MVLFTTTEAEEPARNVLLLPPFTILLLDVALELSFDVLFTTFEDPFTDSDDDTGTVESDTVSSLSLFSAGKTSEDPFALAARLSVSGEEEEECEASAELTPESGGDSVLRLRYNSERYTYYTCKWIYSHYTIIMFVL